MKQYKLYIFDLDGTLLDSDKMLIETFHYLYRKYKPADYVIDDNKIITFSGPQIRDTLLKEFPELDQEKMLKEWRVESVKNYPKFTKLFPGSIELLSTLVEKGIPTAIYTNKHRFATDEAFKLFGISKLNLYSLAGDETPKLKPEPDGIFECMKHFDITDKSEVIYIGDTVYDYDTAMNAGVDFGLVDWTPRKLPENAKISVKIHSFSELRRSL